MYSFNSQSQQSQQQRDNFWGTGSTTTGSRLDHGLSAATPISGGGGGGGGFSQMTSFSAGTPIGGGFPQTPGMVASSPRNGYFPSTPGLQASSSTGASSWGGLGGGGDGFGESRMNGHGFGSHSVLGGGGGGGDGHGSGFNPQRSFSGSLPRSQSPFQGGSFSDSVFVADQQYNAHGYQDSHHHSQQQQQKYMPTFLMNAVRGNDPYSHSSNHQEKHHLMGVGGGGANGVNGLGSPWGGMSSGTPGANVGTSRTGSPGPWNHSYQYGNNHHHHHLRTRSRSRSPPPSGGHDGLYSDEYGLEYGGGSPSSPRSLARRASAMAHAMDDAPPVSTLGDIQTLPTSSSNGSLNSVLPSQSMQIPQSPASAGGGMLGTPRNPTTARASYNSLFTPASPHSDLMMSDLSSPQNGGAAPSSPSTHAPPPPTIKNLQTHQHHPLTAIEIVGWPTEQFSHLSVELKRLADCDVKQGRNFLTADFGTHALAVLAKERVEGWAERGAFGDAGIRVAVRLVPGLDGAGAHKRSGTTSPVLLPPAIKTDLGARWTSGGDSTNHANGGAAAPVRSLASKDVSPPVPLALPTAFTKKQSYLEDDGVHGGIQGLGGVRPPSLWSQLLNGVFGW